jgi:hypothetical protein
MVEFAYNNTAMGHLPFYANYRFHPNTGLTHLRTNILPVPSKASGDWMMAIHNDCHRTLEQPHETLKRYADKDHAEAPKYSTGDLGKLIGKNFQLRHPCKNLHHKLHGLFEITEVLSSMAVRLHLPAKWNIHMVFHVSVLEPFVQGHREVIIQNGLEAADPIEADDEYQVEEVISSMESRGKVTYLVK